MPPDILDAALDLWSHAEGEHFLTITGQSMLPLIRPGDHVLIQKGNIQLATGDIVVFISKAGLVTHRLLAFLPEQAGEIELLAKGDHIPYPDPPLGKANVIGKVVGIKRGLRFMRIDTNAWRRVNSLIVAMMLPMARSYRQVDQLDRKNVGSWLSAIFYRMANFCLMFFLTLFLPLFSHWETVS